MRSRERERERERERGAVFLSTAARRPRRRKTLAHFFDPHSPSVQLPLTATTRGAWSDAPAVANAERDEEREACFGRVNRSKNSGVSVFPFFFFFFFAVGVFVVGIFSHEQTVLPLSIDLCGSRFASRSRTKCANTSRVIQAREGEDKGREEQSGRAQDGGLGSLAGAVACRRRRRC